MKVEEYIASGILEQYVLGELSPRQEEEVVVMAEKHPVVKQELTLIQETLEDMAFQLAKPPSPQVLELVKTEIAKDEQVRNLAEPKKSEQKEKSKKIRYWQYGVAATFTLKVVFMAIAASFWLNWKNTENKLTDLQEKYTELNQKSSQLAQTLIAISDPGIEKVVLDGEKSMANQQLLAYWNPSSNQFLVNLQKITDTITNQTLHVWSLRDNQPEHVGSVSVDKNQLYQIIDLTGKSDMAAIALSLSASSDQPEFSSTDVIASGNLK